MKLHVRHTFPCTADRFWTMYWDEDYDRMLQRDATVDVEVVEERREGDRVVRRLRFTPHEELPSAAASILGSRKLVYEQENTWDPIRKVIRWRVIPTLLPGKLDAAGEFVVEPRGETCERVVRGEITVRVPLVGGRIEAAVVGQVEKSYDKAASVANEWLRKHQT